MRIKIIYEEFSILMRIEEDTYIKNILSFYRKIKFLGIKENTILHLINHENKIMNEKDIIKFTLNKNLYLKSEEFFIKENIKCKKLNIKRIYKIPKENIFYLILIEKIYPNFKYSSLDQFYSNDKDIKNSERYNNLTFLIMKTTDAKEKIEIKQRPIRNSLFTNINNINNRNSNNYDPNFPSFLDIIESFENYSNNNSNIFPLIIRDERNNLMHMYLENYETYFSHRNRSFDNPLRSRSISISRSISESNESNINNRNRSIEFSNDSIDNNNNNNEENDSDFIHESFNNNYSNIIPDPNMINSLVELGFSREISINALRMVGNDITAATDLILSDLINLENIQESNINSQENPIELNDNDINILDFNQNTFQNNLYNRQLNNPDPELEFGSEFSSSSGSRFQINSETIINNINNINNNANLNNLNNINNLNNNNINDIIDINNLNNQLSNFQRNSIEISDRENSSFTINDTNSKLYNIVNINDDDDSKFNNTFDIDESNSKCNNHNNNNNDNS